MVLSWIIIFGFGIGLPVGNCWRYDTFLFFFVLVHVLALVRYLCPGVSGYRGQPDWAGRGRIGKSYESEGKFKVRYCTSRLLRVKIGLPCPDHNTGVKVNPPSAIDDALSSALYVPNSGLKG